MIKLNTLQEICSGLAWANESNPLKDEFEVDVTLPFPFYEALQQELLSTLNANPVVVTGGVDLNQPMKFTKVVLPNGVRMNIKSGKEGIVIQPVKKQKTDASQLLLPFNAERN